MQVQTFNISLPQALVKRADKVAKKEYRNRSDIIREALKKYMDDAEEWEQIFRAGSKAAKKLGIKSEADVDRIVYNYRHGRK